MSLEIPLLSTSIGSSGLSFTSGSSTFFSSASVGFTGDFASCGGVSTGWTHC